MTEGSIAKCARLDGRTVFVAGGPETVADDPAESGYYTATLRDADMAQWIADMPQLAGNGHRVEVDGATITLSGAALAVLADLDSDNDGHYDGTSIWVGGLPYEARPV